MINNPALVDIAPLIGEWDMELSNADFLLDPGQKVPGTVSFSWIESNSLIAMRQGGDATWVIGRDEEGDDYTILYYDSREVSRVYKMSYKDKVWKIWRNNPDFMQRYKGCVSNDGNTITSYWEKSFDGGKTWEHDFDMKFTKRVKA